MKDQTWDSRSSSARAKVRTTPIEVSGVRQAPALRGLSYVEASSSLAQRGLGPMQRARHADSTADAGTGGLDAHGQRARGGLRGMDGHHAHVWRAVGEAELNDAHGLAAAPLLEQGLGILVEASPRPLNAAHLAAATVLSSASLSATPHRLANMGLANTGGASVEPRDLPLGGGVSVLTTFSLAVPVKDANDAVVVLAGHGASASNSDALGIYGCDLGFIASLAGTTYVFFGDTWRKAVNDPAWLSPTSDSPAPYPGPDATDPNDSFGFWKAWSEPPQFEFFSQGAWYRPVRIATQSVSPSSGIPFRPATRKPQPVVASGHVPLGDLQVPSGAFATNQFIYVSIPMDPWRSFQLARLDPATKSFDVLPQVFDQTRAFPRPSGETYIVDRFLNASFASGAGPITIDAGPDGHVIIDNPIFVWGRAAYEAYYEYEDKFAKGSNAPLGSESLGAVADLLDVHLMVFDGVILDFGDVVTWHFIGGSTPKWSKYPDASVAVEGAVANTWAPPNEIPVVQQMSVKYDPHLKLWVMIYGGRSLSPYDYSAIRLEPRVVSFESEPSYGIIYFGPRHYENAADQAHLGLRIRTAKNPWGPWSVPTHLYNGYPDGDVDCSLMWNAKAQGTGCVDADGAPVPLQNVGTPPAPWFNGMEYGCSIWHFEATGPGITRMYFAMSTFNPYHVILMTSTLQHGPALPQP